MGDLFGLYDSVKTIAAQPYELFMPIMGMLFDEFHAHSPEYSAAECAETIADLVKQINSSFGEYSPCGALEGVFEG